MPDRPVGAGRRGPRARPTPPGSTPRTVVALVTEKGGPTSHTAIIARQLGIPCVVGVAGLLDAPRRHPRPGRRYDGRGARSSRTPRRPRAQVAEARAAREALDRWTGPGRTADGTPVKLLANVADGASAAAAGAGPVEGVGLFRTELCFLNRKDEPSRRGAGRHLRRRCSSPFGGDRYVVVRTLDAGSDKPIAFATHEGEENPALGVRGLRLSFGNPGLMERQLAGIAAGRRAHRHRDLGDGADGGDRRRGRGVRRPGARPRAQGGRDGGDPERRAARADQMLEVVDFLSIGTNDLTQYTMAADRMATDLAHLTDAWQPAVLQLIAITAEAGQAGRQAGRGLRRGGRRPDAGHRPGGHGHHVAVDGAGRRPARWARSSAAVTHGRLRAGRRGGARRPSTRWPPATPCARCWRAEVSRRGVTVTGTPESTALPLTSSTAGSVRSFIDAPGSSTACAQPHARPPVPVAVRQADHARHHVVAGLHLDLDRAHRRGHAHDGAVGDRRARPGRRGACRAGAVPGPW